MSKRHSRTTNPASDGSCVRKASMATVMIALPGSYRNKTKLTKIKACSYSHRCAVSRPMNEYRTEQVLIWGKTYPELSRRYSETVCTAGLRQDGTPIRLYPVPLRYLGQDNQ